MRFPDRIGQAVELGQVLLTVRRLAAPPFGVDRRILSRSSGVMSTPSTVSSSLREKNAHSRLAAGDLAVLELHEPQQRPQVLAVSGPEVAAPVQWAA